MLLSRQTAEVLEPLGRVWHRFLPLSSRTFHQIPLQSLPRVLTSHQHRFGPRDPHTKLLWDSSGGRRAARGSASFPYLAEKFQNKAELSLTVSQSSLHLLGALSSYSATL